MIAKPKAPPTEPAKLSLKPPSPAKQVQFYQLLVAARKRWFSDALSEALGQVDQKIVKDQIAKLVPADAQKILAVAALRDEYVFPAGRDREETIVGRILSPALRRFAKELL